MVAPIRSSRCAASVTCCAADRVPRQSLRSLTLWFLAIFLAATIGTGFATFSATRRTIARTVDARIAAAASIVADDSAHPTTATMLHRIDTLARDRDTGDIGFLLVDGQGRRLGGNIDLRRAMPPGFSELRVDDRIKGLSEGRAFTRPVGAGRVLTVVAETEPFDHYAGARIRIYLLGFGSIVLIVVTGMILFARLVHRRIAAIRITVDAIIDGDMRRRVPIDGDGGTFDAQASAFNRMLDRISDLMRGISEVSSDIAHDLRTPLARLRSRLATLEQRAETPAMREDIAAATAQADTLLAMFAAMLRIAEVEGGDRRADFAPLDLAELADEIGTMMAPVVQDRDHDLAIGPFASLPVSGDRQLLTQALINLIENAARHTPPGTRIAVSTAQRGRDAVLVVGDDGPGIRPEDHALVLRRFGQVDRARGRGGYGLGLPLVEAIMRLHRGGIALEDAAPGLRVVLTLPLARIRT